MLTLTVGAVEPCRLLSVLPLFLLLLILLLLLSLNSTIVNYYYCDQVIDAWRTTQVLRMHPFAVGPLFAVDLGFGACGFLGFRVWGLGLVVSVL